MTAPRFSVLLLAVAFGTGACQNNRTPAPTQDQGQSSPGEITLQMGTSTFVDDVEIRFSGVLEDSRCPSDVQCVWAGNARAALGVGPRRGTQGPTEQVLLNTGEGARSGESWGLRVTLVDLTPVPKSTEAIPAESYVVRLKVEAVEP